MDNFIVISYVRYVDFRMKVLVVLLTLSAAGMAVGAPQIGSTFPAEPGSSQPMQSTEAILEFCKGPDCGSDCRGFGDCRGWVCTDDCDYTDEWNAHCGDGSTDCHVVKTKWQSRSTSCLFATFC